MSAWTKTYDLSKDDKLISEVQHATLNTSDYGLVPEIALYGSKDWWEAISTGAIPKIVTEGIITNIFSSGDSNWPQFEIEADGETTTWTRFGEDSSFEIGRRVKLEYVVQKAKKSWTGSPYQNEVLTICVQAD